VNGNRPTLRLLSRAAPATRASPDTNVPHRANGSRRRVLYVSGGDEARVLFLRVARRWENVKLLVAGNAEEGLALAIARRPGMVVLDAHLSDLDGEKLVMALREQALDPSTPIVVLAHDGAPGERARFIWAGASAYIAKPLNVAEIDRTVGMLLEVAALR